jgi:hypothetical protein
LLIDAQISLYYFYTSLISIIYSLITTHNVILIPSSHSISYTHNSYNYHSTTYYDLPAIMSNPFEILPTIFISLPMITYIYHTSIITSRSIPSNYLSCHSSIYSLSIYIFAMIIASLSFALNHLLSLYITQNLISCNHSIFVELILYSIYSSMSLMINLIYPTLFLLIQFIF